jgi:dimethylhistidine N-methyltransferase
MNLSHSAQDFPIITRFKPEVDRRIDAIARLAARPVASIAPGWFYDAQGCALYEAITALDEYYPTRTEQAIFAAHMPEIARMVGRGAQLIDLGSGDSKKAAQLLPALQCSRYLAVDIAQSAIMDALPRLAKVAPQVALAGLVTDFSERLALEGLLDSAHRLFFYPGSSIGNYTPHDACEFLKRIRTHCRAGMDGLLIGVDSVKDHARLDAAYDDALGVTAAFNLNALRHINRVIGSNFDVRDWQHRGFFNAEAARIEMHLEARRDVQVTIGEAQRRFAAGERIHTENSYKYDRGGFAKLLNRAGFVVEHYFTDDAHDFHVFYALAAETLVGDD